MTIQEAPSPEFGAILRDARTAAGLSQLELADLLGVKRQQIGQLERGERNSTWPAVLRLVAVLGAPLAERLASQLHETADLAALPNPPEQES